MCKYILKTLILILYSTFPTVDVSSLFEKFLCLLIVRKLFQLRRLNPEFLFESIEKIRVGGVPHFNTYLFYRFVRAGKKSVRIVKPYVEKILHKSPSGTAFYERAEIVGSEVYCLCNLGKT